MSDERTCTHQPCTCKVTGDDIYCSEQCKQAVEMKAADNVRCNCDHTGCGGH